MAVQQEYQTGIFDRYPYLSNEEIIARLKQEINAVQNREKSALSALDSLKEQLSQRDEYLQLMTDELKAKNVEIQQKNQHLYEYEVMLRESKETIQQLEEKLQSANIKVTSLERELEEKENSMAQLEINHQNSQLQMQEKLSEKDRDLWRLQEQLRQFDSLISSDNAYKKGVASLEELAYQEERVAIKKNNSEENAFLRHYHNLSSSLENATKRADEAELSNKELRRKLAVKNAELKQLQRQFLEFQKERINALSKAIAVIHQRGSKGADAEGCELELGSPTSF